jgi:hypothetical protein
LKLLANLRDRDNFKAFDSAFLVNITYLILLMDLQFTVNNYIYDPRSIPATAEPYIVVEEPFKEVESDTSDVDAYTLDPDEEDENCPPAKPEASSRGSGPHSRAHQPINHQSSYLVNPINNALLAYPRDFEPLDNDFLL